jgi:hypothetical protein
MEDRGDLLGFLRLQGLGPQETREDADDNEDNAVAPVFSGVLFL